MRKQGLFFALIVFVTAVSLYFHFKENGASLSVDSRVYREDFEKEPLLKNEEDKDFWFYADMENDEQISGKKPIKNGKFILKRIEGDKNPYLLSRPIKIKKKQIVKIKRRLKLTPSDKYYSAGLVLFQTPEKRLIVNNDAKLPYGAALVMVEYVSNVSDESKRPGKKGTRVLTPEWKNDRNFKVLETIFDEFFEEELSYNSSTGEIVYKNPKGEYSYKTSKLSTDMIRIWMHSYGNSSEQSVEIDWVELSVTSIEEKELSKEK